MLHSFFDALGAMISIGTVLLSAQLGMLAYVGKQMAGTVRHRRRELFGKHLIWMLAAVGLACLMIGWTVLALAMDWTTDSDLVATLSVLFVLAITTCVCAWRTYLVVSDD